MYSSWDSEYLLQKRALGDELAEEAHKAIEEIFEERGEKLPPRPTHPILLRDNNSAKSGGSKLLRNFALVAFVLIAMAISKAIAHTWLGLLISVLVVSYFVLSWLRRQTLSPEEMETEKQKKKIESEGLTELMVASAEGNLVRVKELLSYGAEVNERSTSGSTALMYAALNNHVEVAKSLLEAGANIGNSSDKGSTAHSIAKKRSYNDMIELLELHGRN